MEYAYVSSRICRMFSLRAVLVLTLLVWLRVWGGGRARQVYFGIKSMNYLSKRIKLMIVRRKGKENLYGSS